MCVKFWKATWHSAQTNTSGLPSDPICEFAFLERGTERKWLELTKIKHVKLILKKATLLQVQIKQELETGY